MGEKGVKCGVMHLRIFRPNPQEKPKDPECEVRGGLDEAAREQLKKVVAVHRVGLRYAAAHRISGARPTSKGTCEASGESGAKSAGA